MKGVREFKSPHLSFFFAEEAVKTKFGCVVKVDMILKKTLICKEIVVTVLEVNNFF